MFAAGDVELIGEREGDRAARVRAIAVAVQATIRATRVFWPVRAIETWSLSSTVPLAT